MCFSPYLGIGGSARGGGVLPREWYTLMRFLTLGNSKIEVSKTYLFNIVII